MAAMSVSSLLAALMVNATGTGNCSLCRLFVTISFIDTYVGWPGSHYPPPGHFILADGGYPCHVLLISPNKRQLQGRGARSFNPHHSGRPGSGSSTCNGWKNIISCHNSLCHPSQHLPWGW